jgi:hypothetical protein
MINNQELQLLKALEEKRKRKPFSNEEIEDIKTCINNGISWISAYEGGVFPGRSRNSIKQKFYEVNSEVEKRIRIVQIRSPKSGDYVKIDREQGEIIGQKKSGPYKNIPILANGGEYEIKS